MGFWNRERNKQAEALLRLLPILIHFPVLLVCWQHTGLHVLSKLLTCGSYRFKFQGCENICYGWAQVEKWISCFFYYASLFVVGSLNGETCPWLPMMLNWGQICNKNRYYTFWTLFTLLNDVNSNAFHCQTESKLINMNPFLFVLFIFVCRYQEEIQEYQDYI